MTSVAGSVKSRRWAAAVMAPKRKRGRLAAFRSDSALGERFMAVLAHQIRALRNRLEERNIRSARERV
jgi:hypothetical protein